MRRRVSCSLNARRLRLWISITPIGTSPDIRGTKTPDAGGFWAAWAGQAGSSFGP
jgi:hypothetical protein